MRKLHLTVVLTVALTVAGGAIALGQAPGSSGIMRQGTATITVVEMSSVSPGILIPDEAREVYHGQGRTTTMTWEASDPRLSGTVDSFTDWSMLRDGSAVEIETFELVNGGGRWVGQSFGLSVPVGPKEGSLVIGLPIEFADPQSQPLVGTDIVLLRGEGGYEGLSALTSIDWRQDPPVINAVIFSGGPMMDLPDLAR